MTLAKVSLYLFSIGAIGLVVAFVLDVVHTTQLAVGRRRATLPAPGGLVPAGAGGGPSGSGAASLGRDGASGPCPTRPRPRPAHWAMRSHG